MKRENLTAEVGSRDHFCRHVLAVYAGNIDRRRSR